MMTKIAITLTTAAAALIAATATNPAEACGPYTPKGVIEYKASAMFTSRDVDDAELASRFPEMSAADRRELRVNKNSFARSRWLEIDGDKATALVEITEKTRSFEVSRFVEVTFTNPRAGDAWGWRPTAIKPASTDRLLALVSAKPAKH